LTAFDLTRFGGRCTVTLTGNLDSLRAGFRGPLVIPGDADYDGPAPCGMR
jgi:hypothetical protein